MPEYIADQIKPAWKLAFDAETWPVSVAFAGSHRRVVAGNQDGILLQWDLPEAPVTGKVKDENGKEIDGVESPPPAKRLVGHDNTVSRLAAVGDGNTLLSVGYDRKVLTWDLNAAPSGESEVVIDAENRQRAARRVEEKKRPEILTAPGLKLPTIAPVATLEGHKDWINVLAVSQNGERILTADDAGQVIVWDAKTRQKVQGWQTAGVAWVAAAALSPDGQSAVVSQYRRKGGDWNNYPAGLRIYNVADGAVKLDILAAMFPKEKNPPYQYQYEYHKFIGEGLVAAAWSPDGKFIALGQGGEGGEGKVHMLEAETGKLLRDVSGHQYGVTDLCFTKDGKYLFTAGRDTTVRIVQVEDGKEIAKLGKPRGGQFFDWLAAISLSPDEKWLAAADISGHIQVWQLTAS